MYPNITEFLQHFTRDKYHNDWLWTGPSTRPQEEDLFTEENDYGIVYISKKFKEELLALDPLLVDMPYHGRNRGLAHELTYIILRGPIPKGQVLKHVCGRTLCCNPEHMRLVPIK